MIKNYFKVAWRNIWKHKVFSGINIIGLAVGMTAFLMILMYVRFELSYDNFHAKADQVYRLNVDINSANDLSASVFAKACSTKAHLSSTETMGTSST